MPIEATGGNNYLPFYLRDIYGERVLPSLVSEGNLARLHRARLSGLANEGDIWSTREQLDGGDWSMMVENRDTGISYSIAYSPDRYVQITRLFPLATVMYEPNGADVICLSISMGDLARQYAAKLGEVEGLVTDQCFETIEQLDDSNSGVYFRAIYDEKGADWLVYTAEVSDAKGVVISHGRLGRREYVFDNQPSELYWLDYMKDFDMWFSFTDNNKDLRLSAFVDPTKTSIGVSIKPKIEMKTILSLVDRDPAEPTTKTEVDRILRNVSSTFKI